MTEAFQGRLRRLLPVDAMRRTSPPVNKYVAFWIA
jgi:hypothetical protein